VALALDHERLARPVTRSTPVMTRSGPRSSRASARADEPRRPTARRFLAWCHKLRKPLNVMLDGCGCCSRGLDAGRRACAQGHRANIRAQTDSWQLLESRGSSAATSSSHAASISCIRGGRRRGRVSTPRPKASLGKPLRRQSAAERPTGARLRQAVSNVLVERRQFRPGGGRITVRLERTASARRLTSATPGGNRPDLFPHLRRYRGETAPSRAHGGRGRLALRARSSSCTARSATSAGPGRARPSRSSCRSTRRKQRADGGPSPPGSGSGSICSDPGRGRRRRHAASCCR